MKVSGWGQVSGCKDFRTGVVMQARLRLRCRICLGVYSILGYLRLIRIVGLMASTRRIGSFADF